MMDSLISPKQPDGFKTESPIRAFTDFQVAGQYAIGKGFRPSMAHLSRYLDAMEAKERWALVQIILPDNDAADPTILFRKTELLLTQSMEVTSDMLPEEVDLTIRKIVIGLGQLRDDMIGQAEARMEDTSVEAKGFLSEAMDQYADRAAGYAAELAALVPVHGAEAVMRQMIAHHGEAVGRAIRKHPALGEPYTPNQHQSADHPVGDVYERFAATVRGKCDWQMVDDFLKEQGFSLVTNGPNEIRVYRADAPLATGSDATTLSSDVPGDLGRQLEA